MSPRRVNSGWRFAVTSHRDQELCDPDYSATRLPIIPAGTEVTLTLPNEGVTLHNFSIDALGINVDIPPGETKTVTNNAPAGSYEYYCNVPGHKPAGMVGTLTAEEP